MRITGRTFTWVVGVGVGEWACVLYTYLSASNGVNGNSGWPDVDDLTVSSDEPEDDSRVTVADPHPKPTPGSGFPIVCVCVCVVVTVAEDEGKPGL